MKQLHTLEPVEVSLVGKAANKKKFLIFKNRKGKTMTVAEQVKQMIAKADPKAMAALEKVVKEMSGGKKEVYKWKGEEPNSSVGQLDERAQAALKAVGRILQPHSDQIHSGHLKEVADAVGVGDVPQKGEIGVDEEQP